MGDQQKKKKEKFIKGRLEAAGNTVDEILDLYESIRL